MPLVVFDLDGTLIDSRHDLADAANALIVEGGGHPLSVEAITAMVGDGAPLLVQRALKGAGLDLDIRVALPRFLELYDERLLVHTRLYDGTREALEAMAPNAMLAILTNKPQRATDRIVEGLEIGPFFRWIVGGDTAHGRKPDPGGLRYLMSAANARPTETVMVGDSGIDLRTARAAGTAICLVRYGFGFPTAAAELAGDVSIVDHPSELGMVLR